MSRLKAAAHYLYARLAEGATWAGISAAAAASGYAQAAFACAAMAVILKDKGSNA
jgi:hypothetical protein